MRAAIYARVSSAAQRERMTIESQLRTLPAFIAERGWTVAGTYVDDGHTAKAGHLDRRDGLARLLADAGAGLFDVVAVVDIDRLTRSEDLGERGAILAAFQRAGVQIAIASSGQVLDLRSSAGDLFAVLGAFFAAEENRKRRERTVAGKLTAIARGRKPAGPTPYGYRYDRETGAWSLDEHEASVIRDIFRWAIAGWTGDEIATELELRGERRPRGGRWIRERVYQILRQTAYRGTWTADRVRGLEVAVPAVVDDATWFAANDRVASKARQLAGLRRTRGIYLLEGIAVCGLCAARVGIATASKRHGATPTRYVCAHRRRPELAGGERCPLPYWIASEADDRVWSALERFILRPDLVDRWARGGRRTASADGEAWRKDLAAAERKREALARSEAAILARFRRGTISEAAMDLELAAAARDREWSDRQVDAARRAAASASARRERVEALDRQVAALRERVRNTSPVERLRFVAALVRPGAATLSLTRIDLAVRLAADDVGQVRQRSCSSARSIDEADAVTFRLVA